MGKKFTKYPILGATSDVVLRSDDGLFELIKESGTGVNRTPWSGLAVRSLGDAKKFVVEIRLDSNSPSFEGEPVMYQYFDDAYVAHGMSMKHEDLDDTRRYIEVLQSAVNFAEECMQWIKNSEYSNGRESRFKQYAKYIEERGM